MEIYARQGDLVISAIAAGHKASLVSHQDLVLAGSDTAPHTVVGEVLALVESTRTLLRCVAPTTITHADRHLPVELSPGDYEITRLRERGGAGDRAVGD
mgnify:CR=1 FL=1